ncbi:hypothetical protein H5410_016928 [Solanum commersonii]|uniref:Pentatricopeptide repeat-containing protein n=1 Tax=Solanum commersonii TaxID=4109 RepID=A0A9J5ZXY7_SOLCO|nr:hypothetical protein H5410_016928 [Solanum commersonii]
MGTGVPFDYSEESIENFENEKEWKRIIQVTKWMLSKGQGRTMGSYFALLNALAEDGRLEEAEELWLKLFSQNLESMPRIFFQKMIAIYYHKEMNEKMFEIFADMEELGIRPTVPVVTMVGNVFQKLGMLDKYQKLKKKYPPPKWEYRYIKGKRVKIRTKDLDKSQDHDVESKSEEVDESEFDENSQDQADEVDEDYVEQITDVEECEPGEISIVSSETRESSMST